MARAHRGPPGGAPRSTRTARDNARARALGYRDYYDFRLHDSGRIPPEVEIPQGGRSRARGHRGTADFLRTLRSGDIIIVPNGLASIELDEKDRYKRIDKLLIDGETGRAETFTLRRITRKRMRDLIHAEAARGAIWSPAPSLDQRRLISVAERPPPVDEAAANREFKRYKLPPWRKR